MITERNRKMLNGWNLFGNSALRLTKVNLQEAHRPVLKEHKHTFFFFRQNQFYPSLQFCKNFGVCRTQMVLANVLVDTGRLRYFMMILQLNVLYK